MTTYFYKRTQLVKIDVADIPMINPHVWQIHKTANNVYLRTSIDGHYVKMHRLLLGVTDPNVKVDHRDGCGLNNTRENLRRCTTQQNTCNGRKRGGTSQFKGVFLDKQTGAWKAQVGTNGRNISLGRFDSEIDAAKAYNAAAVKFHGEFARINELQAA